MSQAAATGSIITMNRTDIDDTLRDMWVTRPRRRSDDKKIAGVAAAIARRYQIDRTLVRVAFVVATFYGGSGILLYLLGWLLLPANDDEVSPAEALVGRGRSSMSTGLTILLGIALIPTTISFFSSAPAALVSGAGIAVGLFLLHRHRGGLGGAPAVAGANFAAAGGAAPGAMAGMPGQPVTPDTQPLGAPSLPGTQPFGARPTDAVPPYAQTTPAAAAASAQPGTEATAAMHRPTDQQPGAPQDRQNPPAWDPLGVAPFAWDLPEPGQDAPPVPQKPRRHRSAVTPVTIGLALVTAGVCAVAAMYDSYLDGPRVVALVLAVVGGGMVVGSFVRGGRGLIPLAIPLAAITWGLAVVPDTHLGSMGDRDIRPTTVADVQPIYEHGAGNIRLDLTNLQVSDNQAVPTRVELGFGNIEVIVPDGADVDATCVAEMGNVDCLGQSSNGPNSRVTVTDYGDDGEGTGGKFRLELVTSGAGNVELKRG